MGSISTSAESLRGKFSRLERPLLVTGARVSLLGRVIRKVRWRGSVPNDTGSGVADGLLAFAGVTADLFFCGVAAWRSGKVWAQPEATSKQSHKYATTKRAVQEAITSKTCVGKQKAVADSQLPDAKHGSQLPNQISATTGKSVAR